MTASSPIQPLAALRPGQRALVRALHDDPSQPGLRQRLMALGFSPGTLVEVHRRAPLGDPSEYALRGGRLSLRRREAALIQVEPVEQTLDARREAYPEDEAWDETDDEDERTSASRDHHLGRQEQPR